MFLLLGNWRSPDSLVGTKAQGAEQVLSPLRPGQPRSFNPGDRGAVLALSGFEDDSYSVTDCGLLTNDECDSATECDRRPS